MRRAEGAATMDDDDGLGGASEVERVLHRRVAAADDEHALPRVREAIARRTRRDAAPAVLVLTRRAEPSRVGAGGDDDRARVDDVGRRVQCDAERPRREVDRRRQVVDAAGAEGGALCAHRAHDFDARAGRNARKVLDVDALALQLAADDGRDEHGLEPGARRVERRRQPGGAAAEHDDLGGRGGGGCGGAAAPSAVRRGGGRRVAPPQLGPKVVGARTARPPPPEEEDDEGGGGGAATVAVRAARVAGSALYFWRRRRTSLAVALAYSAAILGASAAFDASCSA